MAARARTTSLIVARFAITCWPDNFAHDRGETDEEVRLLAVQLSPFLDMAGFVCDT
jgi:hypothetical protein